MTDDRSPAQPVRRPRQMASKLGHQGTGYHLPTQRACKGCENARWHQHQYDCRLFEGCDAKRWIRRDDDGFVRLPKSCGKRIQE